MPCIRDSSDLVVSPAPAPRATPISGTGWAFVSIFGVRAIPAEVTPLSALVTPHTRIETPPATSSGSWSGHGDSHPPPTDILAIGRPTRLVRVLLPLENHKGKAGHTFGHPDLLNAAKPLEDILQVPLAGSAIKVGYVKSLSLELL